MSNVKKSTSMKYFTPLENEIQNSRRKKPQAKDRHSLDEFDGNETLNTILGFMYGKSIHSWIECMNPHRADTFCLRIHEKVFKAFETILRYNP